MKTGYILNIKGRVLPIRIKMSGYMFFTKKHTHKEYGKPY